VVFAVVAGNPLLNEWVRRNDSQEDEAYDERNQDVE
jgi:hypothetical protein